MCLCTTGLTTKTSYNFYIEKLIKKICMKPGGLAVVQYVFN